MKRQEEIQDRLDHHFEKELGIAVISMDEPRWAFNDLGTYLHYGWAFPVAVNPAERHGDLHATGLAFWADEYIASFLVPGTSPPLLFVYCPEVIANSTMNLSSTELDSYLTCIEFMVDRYVSLRVEVSNGEERLRRVESDLYETMGPDALQFVTTVQMGSLPPSVAS